MRAHPRKVISKAAWLVPWATLLIGLSVTALVTASAYRDMRARDAERFGYEVEQLLARLETRIRTYGQALMGARDWFAAHSEITESLWTNYVYTLHPASHYPGMVDIGFVEFVQDTAPRPSHVKLDTHLERMRQRFGPDYKLRLPPWINAPLTWYSMPVVWHSYSQWRHDPPRDYRWYGLDLNQDPDLWSAMNWALGQDVPAMSGRQHIDPDDLAKRGVILFLPVYGSSLDRAGEVVLNDFELKLASTAEAQERFRQVRRYQSALRGLIFGAIDIDAFLAYDLGTNAPRVTFALYASTNQEPSEASSNLLFDNRTVSGGRTAARAGKSTKAIEPSQARDIRMYGRTLRFVARPGPGFVSNVHRRALGLAAGFGAAATLLLAGFIAYQVKARARELEIAEALRASEGHLQNLLFDRERMSRDLHDGTIQSLYAIGLGLGRIGRALGPMPERERLEASLAELDHVIAELRGFLVTLDPGVSPAQSAASALAELVTRLRHTTATELRFKPEPGVGDGWPPAAVLDLLHAAREAISNALRHGKATTVDLALRASENGEIQFIIADNGTGFDPAALKPEGGGHGFANLERRAQAWQGSVHVQSRIGGPTRVTLVLFPIGSSAPENPTPPRSANAL